MILASFIIEGLPVAKARPRATMRGGVARMYTPAKTRSYEDAVSERAREVCLLGKPFSGAIELEAHFTLPVPKSWSKRARVEALAGAVLPSIKPDLDNFVKALQDGLNGTVFADDSQIVSLRTTKRYGADPGVAVTVRTV